MNNIKELIKLSFVIFPLLKRSSTHIYLVYINIEHPHVRLNVCPPLIIILNLCKRVQILRRHLDLFNALKLMFEGETTTSPD